MEADFEEIYHLFLYIDLLGRRASLTFYETEGKTLCCNTLARIFYDIFCQDQRTFHLYSRKPLHPKLLYTSADFLGKSRVRLHRDTFGLVLQRFYRHHIIEESTRPLIVIIEIEKNAYFCENLRNICSNNKNKISKYDEKIYEIAKQ